MNSSETLWGVHMDASVGTDPTDKGYVAIGWNQLGDLSKIQASREAFKKADPGFAERFGVGHDVRLCDGHEIGGIEELADRDLMLDGPKARRAELAGEERALLLVQSHG